MHPEQWLCWKPQVHPPVPGQTEGDCAFLWKRGGSVPPLLEALAGASESGLQPGCERESPAGQGPRNRRPPCQILRHPLLPFPQSYPLGATLCHLRPQLIDVGDFKAREIPMAGMEVLTIYTLEYLRYTLDLHQ